MSRLIMNTNSGELLLIIQCSSKLLSENVHLFVLNYFLITYNSLIATIILCNLMSVNADS